MLLRGKTLNSDRQDEKYYSLSQCATGLLNAPQYALSNPFLAAPTQRQALASPTHLVPWLNTLEIMENIFRIYLCLDFLKS